MIRGTKNNSKKVPRAFIHFSLVKNSPQQFFHFQYLIFGRNFRSQNCLLFEWKRSWECMFWSNTMWSFTLFITSKKNLHVTKSYPCNICINRNAEWMRKRKNYSLFRKIPQLCIWSCYGVEITYQKKGITSKRSEVMIPNHTCNGFFYRTHSESCFCP